MVAEPILPKTSTMSSSSPAAAAASSSIDNNPTVRLNRQNYLLWVVQQEPILRGRRLLGYADGTIQAPPTTIKISETVDGKAVEKMVPNPEYDEWLTNDQLVLGRLVTSLEPDVLMQIVGLKTSTAVWSALATSFAA
jgi:hypothetical protein